MQETTHIKSETKATVVHSWVAVLHRLITCLVSSALLLLATKSQAEPHSTVNTAEDRADTTTSGVIIASTSNSAHQIAAPSSVVQFEVPIQRVEDGKRRNFIENCSAYAVHKTSEHYFFLSSWHCIDGYQRNRRSPSVKHGTISARPRLGESGGNMKRDWLLMTTPKIAFGDSLSLTPLASEPVKIGEILYGFGWGGYAQGLRSKTKALTCEAIEVGRQLTLDCGFSKGDSGGLVARRISGGYEAVGIISAGDSATVTYAYPISTLPPKVSAQLLTRED